MLMRPPCLLLAFGRPGGMRGRAMACACGSWHGGGVRSLGWVAGTPATAALNVCPAFAWTTNESHAVQRLARLLSGQLQGDLHASVVCSQGHSAGLQRRMVVTTACAPRTPCTSHHGRAGRRRCMSEGRHHGPWGRGLGVLLSMPSEVCAARYGKAHGMWQGVAQSRRAWQC